MPTPNPPYQGSQAVTRGIYAAPIRVVRDKRGEVKRFECDACGRQVGGAQRDCLCGVSLLGRVTVVR